MGVGSMTRPYRPCNGSEGEWFESRFCDRCKHDAEYRADDTKEGCQILALALCFGIDDPAYPPQWVEDNDGSNPRCIAFEAMG